MPGANSPPFKIHSHAEIVHKTRNFEVEIYFFNTWVNHSLVDSPDRQNYLR